MVQLYEKGYGKDAAGIAMEAINYARETRVDVVLIDTAGRMQDNEPLMRALAKVGLMVIRGLTRDGIYLMVMMGLARDGVYLMVIRGFS